MAKLKSLETFAFERRPQVCGIDDRADDCQDEICDRLMRHLPISGKRVHIEPAMYIENYQVMGINPPDDTIKALQNKK